MQELNTPLGSLLEIANFEVLLTDAFFGKGSGKTVLALCSSLTGEVQREVLIPSPWDPLTGHIGIAQRGTKGGSDWT